MLEIPSPNFDRRPVGVKPSMIIIHYTGMGSALQALEAMCDKVAKVSAHYMIDEDGLTVPLVPDAKRAWHAGLSYWAGEEDVNSHSIGIELVNPGHEHGYVPFPKKQMEALSGLCKVLIDEYQIPAHRVLGHSDVAPERKIDPGELFDWKWLAAQGVGLWPEPTDADYQEANKSENNDRAVAALFTQFGYNPLMAQMDIVRGFHLHFYPEKIGQEASDVLDHEGYARLVALVRMMKQAIA